MLHGDIVQIRCRFRRGTLIPQIAVDVSTWYLDVPTWFSRHDPLFMPEDSTYIFRPQHTCDSGPRSEELPHNGSIILAIMRAISR